MSEYELIKKALNILDFRYATSIDIETNDMYIYWLIGNKVLCETFNEEGEHINSEDSFMTEEEFEELE
jgi:hypothetical protein